MAEGLLCYTRLNDPLDTIIHTQGRPLSPEDEVRIVDEDDHDVPEGQVGQLLTRGPYTIRGYFRAPVQNASSFTEDGFYRSGDLVRRDANGNLTVEGRIKEQINRCGEKFLRPRSKRQSVCFTVSMPPPQSVCQTSCWASASAFSSSRKVVRRSILCTSRRRCAKEV